MKILTALLFSLCALSAKSQSLKFYGTNGNVGYRFWTFGNPCAPDDIGVGVQYIKDGGGTWHGYLATVTWESTLVLTTFTYNSGNYGGPTNSFTITLCTPEVPPLVPYSFACIGDDLGVFTLNLPVE